MVIGSTRELREALRAAEGSLAAAEARLEVKSEQVAYLRTQVDEKDKLIASMVREGYRPDLAPEVELEDLPDLPGEVMRAIEEIADPNTALYHDLVKGAETELQEEDVTAEQVADGILTGGDFNPYA